MHHSNGRDHKALQDLEAQSRTRSERKMPQGHKLLLASLLGVILLSSPVWGDVGLETPFQVAIEVIMREQFPQESYPGEPTVSMTVPVTAFGAIPSQDPHGPWLALTCEEIEQKFIDWVELKIIDPQSGNLGGTVFPTTLALNFEDEFGWPKIINHPNIECAVGVARDVMTNVYGVQNLELGFYGMPYADINNDPPHSEHNRYLDEAQFVRDLDVDFAIPVLYVNSQVDDGSGEDWRLRIEDRARESIEIAGLIDSTLPIRPFFWHLVKLDVPIGPLSTDRYRERAAAQPRPQSVPVSTIAGWNLG